MTILLLYTLRVFKLSAIVATILLILILISPNRVLQRCILSKLLRSARYIYT